MPYITEDRRNALDHHQRHPNCAGELNYMFCMLASNYFKEHGANYQAYNDVIGALEGAKLELYRRRVAPYEDAARDRNGDLEPWR